MSRLNTTESPIVRTPAPGLQASGTPLSALGGPKKPRNDGGASAAADAIKKFRASAGTAGDDEDDEGEPSGQPQRRNKPKKPAKPEGQSKPRQTARNDAEGEGEDEGQAEAEAEGEDEGGEEPAQPAPRKRATPGRNGTRPKAEDDDEGRTRVNGDYARPVDGEGEDDGAEGEEVAEGGEGEEAEEVDPLASLAEQYRAELTGEVTPGAQNNGQQNGQGHALPGQQQPPNPGSGRPEGGQGQQAPQGAAPQLGESIFSKEEIQSLRDDGNEATAAVMEAANTRLGTRLQQVETMLLELASETIAGMQRRNARTMVEDREFFDKAAAGGYAKVLGDTRKGGQVPAPIARNRKAVVNLANRILRDQLGSKEPSFLAREKALDVAARALFPGVTRKQAVSEGKRSVEEQIQRRHRGLSLTPSGGQRGEFVQRGGARGQELDAAADAVRSFRLKRGVA